MAGRGRQKQTALAETYDGSTPLKSVQQEMFVAHIMRGMCQTEAYKNAGYKTGQSENALMAHSSRLVRNGKVAARLAYKRGQLAKKMDVSAERVVLERARIAFADPAEMFDANGATLPIHEMPEDIRRAIAGVDVEELYEGRGENRKKVGEVVKPRLWNKNDALESLEKQLGLFEKDNNQKRGLTILEILAIVDGSRNE